MILFYKFFTYKSEIAVDFDRIDPMIVRKFLITTSDNIRLLFSALVSIFIFANACHLVFIL